MGGFFRILFVLALVAAPAVAFGGQSPAGDRYSASPLVIGGTIVTPAGVKPHAWLVVEDGRIASISDSKPALPGAKVLQTSDLIFPGFIDLHNHPLWAVFQRFSDKPRPASPLRAAHKGKVVSASEASATAGAGAAERSEVGGQANQTKPEGLNQETWPNRYAWRADARYLAALQNPWWDMMSHGAFCDLDEYAELQALIGGTTSILGLDLVDDTKPAPACIIGLARNLDYASGFHGSGTSNEAIAWVLGVTSDMKPDALKRLKQKMAHGDLDAVVVHTAEGQRNDAESKTEFGRLKSLGLLEARTTVVHGVALTPADFAQMARVGAGLVWSPRSNMELYGQMPDLAAARKAGVSIALAPDWAPTGSTNMLGEIQYADGLKQGFSQKQLFDMATDIPARMAHIFPHVGSLAPGLQADLFLLHGSGDPYKALATARPQDVTLTMVNGVAIYGAPANLTALGAVKTEAFAVCGAGRAFNSAALAKPFARLQADLAARMTAHHLKLAPLVYCH